MEKLVSCILPTRNRGRFLRQALRCFQRQTYKPAELLVLDDGEQTVEEVCSGVDGVRYIRLDEPMSIGQKLNLGIEQARGEILQKLDDDDYYHPDFLRVAVENLPPDPRGSLLAWDCFLVLLVGEKQLRYSGHGWKTGGTLCFTRPLWERAGFQNVRVGTDSLFVKDHAASLSRVCAPELYIVVRHGRNTWTLMADGELADDYLRTLPPHAKPKEALLGPADLAFYESLETWCSGEGA